MNSTLFEPTSFAECFYLFKVQVIKFFLYKMPWKVSNPQT